MPETEAAVRQIAAKGRRLLDRHKAEQAQGKDADTDTGTDKATGSLG